MPAPCRSMLGDAHRQAAERAGLDVRNETGQRRAKNSFALPANLGLRRLLEPMQGFRLKRTNLLSLSLNSFHLNFEADLNALKKFGELFDIYLRNGHATTGSTSPKSRLPRLLEPGERL